MEELKDLPGRYDLIILPQDPVSFVLNHVPQVLERPKPRKRELYLFCRYLSTKVYDLLDHGGRLVVLCPRVIRPDGEALEIRFRDRRKLKNFLLFSHIIKSGREYRQPKGSDRLKVLWWDFFNFLTLEMVPLKRLRRLTRGKTVGELTLTEIDRLPPP